LCCAEVPLVPGAGKSQNGTKGGRGRRAALSYSREALDRSWQARACMLPWRLWSGLARCSQSHRCSHDGFDGCSNLHCLYGQCLLHQVPRRYTCTRVCNILIWFTDFQLWQLWRFFIVGLWASVVLTVTDTCLCPCRREGVHQSRIGAPCHVETAACCRWLVRQEQLACQRAVCRRSTEGLCAVAHVVQFIASTLPTAPEQTVTSERKADIVRLWAPHLVKASSLNSLMIEHFGPESLVILHACKAW
jgi:hypothetical protein